MRSTHRMSQTRLLAAGLIGFAASACAGGYAEVATAPPPERVEVVEAAPGPDLVWVSGYWDWGGANYIWVPGRWAHPPGRHRVWVRDSWAQRGNHWRRTRGHWQ